MNPGREAHLTFCQNGLYCCNLGRENIAKLLIENGADVNAKGEDEFTPLFQSTRNGNKIFQLDTRIYNKLLVCLKTRW